jgi:hypothetical protein
MFLCLAQYIPSRYNSHPYLRELKKYKFQSFLYSGFQEDRI